MCPPKKFLLLSLVVEMCWVTGRLVVSLHAQGDFTVDISLLLPSTCTNTHTHTHLCTHSKAHVYTHVHKDSRILENRLFSEQLELAFTVRLL